MTRKERTSVSHRRHDDEERYTILQQTPAQTPHPLAQQDVTVVFSRFSLGLVRPCQICQFWQVALRFKPNSEGIEHV